MTNTMRERFEERFGRVVPENIVVDVGGDTDVINLKEEFCVFIDSECAKAREDEVRKIWKFGERQGWDNQTMTDIRNFLSYGFDPSSPQEGDKSDEI